MSMRVAATTKTRKSVAALSLALVTTGLTVMAGTQPAAASGCSLPPCGAVKNNSNVSIKVRYNDDNTTWKYLWVSPGKTIGGYWNDGRDIDGFYAPSGCRTDWSTHAGAIYASRGVWEKVSSNETATIRGVTCPG
jgi:hypothetical protein